jgi:hypothetical protein
MFVNQPKRPLKLKNGKTVTIEWLGEQHYLIWIDGNAVTEVQTVPVGSNNWYWTDSGRECATNREYAIQRGIAASKVFGSDYGRSWTRKARISINKETIIKNRTI